MNDARFWRAHDEYYSPPEDDCEECEECGGTGEAEHDCGDDVCCCEDPEPVPCEECEGYGTISRRERRQRFLDEKADYEYQCWKDRKAEEEL